ncbi:MAG: enoyl-CoA hydratase, partial [Deltaproteobacteria bacterium]|nr:enoyl-CoA hydratase [Deltaproteobacteria bacterium]
VVGISKALEMLLMDRWVDAEEAYQIKLVNEVVPGDKLLERAEELAETIAESPPIAVRYAKQAVVRGLDLPLPEGLVLEKHLATLLKNSFR